MNTYTIVANGVALRIWAPDLEAATRIASVHIASINGSRTITSSRVRDAW